MSARARPSPMWRWVKILATRGASSGFGDVPRLRLPAGEAPGRDWEFYVARLIEESRIVVLVCHWGSAGDWGAAGFHRELEIIAEQKAVEKTIFITYILDHLGWASLLASLDDKQLRACLEAAPVSDAIVKSLVECSPETMKGVKLVSIRMTRFDWSHADPLKVNSIGV